MREPVDNNSVRELAAAYADLLKELSASQSVTEEQRRQIAEPLVRHARNCVYQESNRDLKKLRLFNWVLMDVMTAGPRRLIERELGAERPFAIGRPQHH